MRRILAAGPLAALRSAGVSAHAGQPLAPHDLWTAWSVEPAVVLPLLASALLYAIGTARLRRAGSVEYAAGSWRTRAFTAGWLALAIALVSPLDALGGALFSGHMVQHELLMLAAAPLLVCGRPGVPFVWALPVRWRGAAGPVLRARVVRHAWTWGTVPLVAWALHALAIWLWHIPALFEATLRSEAVHVLQHAAFFGTALLFWWALLERRDARTGYGAAVFHVFTTAVHTSVLGALLTFASEPWYPAYATSVAPWGMTPLEDQQLGGLIMWVPGGAAYMAPGLWLFARWLQRSAAQPEPLRGR